MKKQLIINLFLWELLILLFQAIIWTRNIRKPIKKGSKDSDSSLVSNRNLSQTIHLSVEARTR